MSAVTVALNKSLFKSKYDRNLACAIFSRAHSLQALFGKNATCAKINRLRLSLKTLKLGFFTNTLERKLILNFSKCAQIPTLKVNIKKIGRKHKEKWLPSLRTRKDKSTQAIIDCNHTTITPMGRPMGSLA